MKLTASLFGECWIPLQEAPTRYAWRGLIQRWQWRQAKRMRVPFGWRAVGEREYGSMLVMPLWLVPLYVLWRDRQWYTYGTLMRLGLWDVNEGDYWISGRWRAPNWLWCFLHDRDARVS